MENLQATTNNNTTAMASGAVQLAEMFKRGYSIGKMAKEFLSDESAKARMHRILQKAIREYPCLFKN
jgi:hypothetical protein